MHFNNIISLKSEKYWSKKFGGLTGQKIQLHFECFYDQFTVRNLFLVILINVLHYVVSGKLALYPNAVFSLRFEILCSVPFYKNTQLTNTSMNKNIHNISREGTGFPISDFLHFSFFIFHTAIPWQKPAIWINPPWLQLP